ncbi:MAG: GNAT family N-acetyltransferase [Sulfitobacter sp.]
MITARLATPADLPAVQPLIHALAAFHGDTPSVTLDQLHRDTQTPRPWITLLLAHEGNTLLGYAALTPLAQLHYGLRGMDMHHLFVSQNARGKGAGRCLIDASLAHARQNACHYLTVGTHPDNAAAAALYRAAGFDPLPPPGPRFRMKL